jgi:hypothetical protein
MAIAELRLIGFMVSSLGFAFAEGARKLLVRLKCRVQLSVSKTHVPLILAMPQARLAVTAINPDLTQVGFAKPCGSKLIVGPFFWRSG